MNIPCFVVLFICKKFFYLYSFYEHSLGKVGWLYDMW